MKLSVVIPTLNEEGYVGHLLGDLACQTRTPDEVIVVDGNSRDATARVVEGFPGVRLLSCAPSVSAQRNLGARSARGDVLVFLDADLRLSGEFLEEFLASFGRRGLDVACPLYVPPRDSSAGVKAIHGLINSLFIAVQKVLASGSGQCIAIRKETFERVGGFDTRLKFADDIEMIRRASRRHRFGIVLQKVCVSDRRFKERGVPNALADLLVMSFFFAIGRFDWSNRIKYEFGNHAPTPAGRRDRSQ